MAVRGTYVDFAEKYLTVVLSTGSEYMCACPAHGGKDSMQFNVDSGLWTCFSCHEGGGIARLAALVGAPSYRKVEADMKDVYAKLRALKKDAVESKDQYRYRDESYLRRFEFPNDYWSGRGFTEETIARYGLGYEPLEDYATIPLRTSEGRLLGVIKRLLNTDDDLKYRYPSKRATGFQRSRDFFASWEVNDNPEGFAVITEGSVDAMKVAQADFPALAQYGSSLTIAQIRLLLRLGIQHAILFYDDDKAGRDALRRAQGIKIHKRGKTIWREYDERLDLRRHGISIETVTYEKGMKSDPGAMNTKEIAQAIDRAERVL